MNNLNVAIDVFPYKEDIWSICDYSGEQIYSKLALPLFSLEKDEIKPLGAESFQQTVDSFRINIRKDLFWSNGDNVKAVDYVRAIKHICYDENNRYNKLLASVAKLGVETEIHNDHSFNIQTSWYDPFITQYLSLLNFSPKHEHDDDVFAGPYVLVKKQDNLYQLIANKYFMLDKNFPAVEKINYLLVEKDPNGEAFFDGKVHVSCNTAVNLKNYRIFTAKKNFVAAEGNLMMMLSPGIKFDKLPNHVKEILTSKINRNTISARYDNILKPVASWMSMYFDGSYYPLRDAIAYKKSSFIIDISYEDFYPNDEILEDISKQLSGFNIEVRKHQDKYGYWLSESHLRFEIRKIPQRNPVQIIRSDLSNISTSHAKFEKIKKLYSMLFTEALSSQQPEIFKVIDFYLRDYCLSLPLFIFPTGFFCHSSILENTLYAPGRKVLIKEAVSEN